jgi:hypothetical protein
VDQLEAEQRSGYVSYFWKSMARGVASVSVQEGRWTIIEKEKTDKGPQEKYSQKINKINLKIFSWEME